ncbi:unnamed protein product [Brachionus calyciflorus]|uniref:Uncharacterized protein n=1 Tax=Brachionus calyciflorus TaxID=104777 RepID=A0A813TGF0_9BILA|nr:unnamed protein product [Brachionus calyciflorus]
MNSKNLKILKSKILILLMINQILSTQSIFQIALPVLINEYVQIKKLELDLKNMIINGTKIEMNTKEDLKKYSILQKYFLSRLKLNYVGKKFSHYVNKKVYAPGFGVFLIY